MQEKELTFPTEVLPETVEADASSLAVDAEQTALEGLKKLGVPFGVSLAEEVDPLLIKPGMDKRSDTATYGPTHGGDSTVDAD